MTDFIYIATFLKHRAFRDEREVRLVASRIEHDDEFTSLQKSSSNPTVPEKTVSYRMNGGRPVPFLKLFESLEMPLPITRVLIGPGEGRFQIAKATEKLLAKTDIEVAISDIPLR